MSSYTDERAARFPCNVGFGTASLKSSLRGSFAFRPSLGWRPFADHGLEALAGYTLIALGADAAGADVVNALLAEKGSTSRLPADGYSTVRLASSIHAFHVSAGWRWLALDDKLSIRASLSYLQCFASSTSADVQLGAGRSRLAQACPRERGAVE
jgi:hypothetical protein